MTNSEPPEPWWHEFRGRRSGCCGARLAGRDLPDPSAVVAVRDRLLAWLKDRLPELRSLESITCSRPAKNSTSFCCMAFRVGIGIRTWDERSSRPIWICFALSWGPICISSAILICAPCGRAETRDAAPLHRDTYYGASAYEVSVVVPFTDMSESCALRVISGSHRAPDSDYPFTQIVSPDVVVRSPKHELGFPYAPRLLDPDLDGSRGGGPSPCGPGAALPLSLVHGGGIDTGTQTRFSTDIRVVNSWAPVSMSRGVHPDYFVPLCASAVTSTARDYQEINQVTSPKESP